MTVATMNYYYLTPSGEPADAVCTAGGSEVFMLAPADHLTYTLPENAYRLAEMAHDAAGRPRRDVVAIPIGTNPGFLYR